MIPSGEPDIVERLLPCPFCGEQPELNDHGKIGTWIQCENKSCDVEPFAHCDTKAETISAWNTRAPITRLRQSQGSGEALDPAVLTAELLRLKNRFDTIFNNVLCEMTPGWDDSIEGFNSAWNIAREIFEEEIGRSAQRALALSTISGTEGEGETTTSVRMNESSVREQSDKVPSLTEVPELESGHRPETGPMQFGPDWPGLFIRGDNAMGYAMYVAHAIQLLPADSWPAKSGLQSLLSDLRSCNARNFPPSKDSPRTEEKSNCDAGNSPITPSPSATECDHLSGETIFCIGCASGNDLSDGDQCKMCGRIGVLPSGASNVVVPPSHIAQEEKE
jgi:hypothetical protein